MANAQTLIQYYADLLILQYLGKPKAYATIETIVTPALLAETSIEQINFSANPASGTFTLSYGGATTSSLAWNASNASIQTAVQTLPGLSSALVTGSIADGLVITNTSAFTALITVSSSLLDSGSNPVSATVLSQVSAIDDTLPLIVQNGFNLIGSNPATGVQLDTLGKYAGVTRNGNGFYVPITLDDADFLTFIQMAIIKNNAGSSLSTIQALLNQYFSGEVLVFDYANMHMNYLINSSIGSQDLAQLFVTEGILPKPMGVQLAAVIYAPVIDAFFGMSTYPLVIALSPSLAVPANDVQQKNASPFNSYGSYQTIWPWLSYQNAVFGGSTVIEAILTEAGEVIDTEDGQAIGLE